MLTEAGVIEHPWEFLLARASRRSAKLQAGEYRFATPASALTVYGRIARGDVFYHELAIPEGQNMFDIAASVESLGLMPAADFLTAARDPSLIRDLDAVGAVARGLSVPRHLPLDRHISARELCRILTHRFR